MVDVRVYKNEKRFVNKNDIIDYAKTIHCRSFIRVRIRRFEPQLFAALTTGFHNMNWFIMCSFFETGFIFLSQGFDPSQTKVSPY